MEASLKRERSVICTQLHGSVGIWDEIFFRDDFGAKIEVLLLLLLFGLEFDVCFLKLFGEVTLTITM